jgi:hypothetical protein
MTPSRSVFFSTLFVLILSACGGGSEKKPEPAPVITITESTYTEVSNGIKTEYLVTTTCTDGNCVEVTTETGITYQVTNTFDIVVQYYNEDTFDQVGMIRHTLPMTDAQVKSNDITGMDIPVISDGQDTPFGYYIRQYDGKLYIKFADDRFENGYYTDQTGWCKRAAPNAADNYCFANLYTNEMSPITYSLTGHTQIDFDLFAGFYDFVSNRETIVGVSLYAADYIDAPEQSWTEDALPETFSAYLCIEATTGEVTQMSIDDVDFVPEARISCPEPKEV